MANDNTVGTKPQTEKSPVKKTGSRNKENEREVTVCSGEINHNKTQVETRWKRRKGKRMAVIMTYIVSDLMVHKQRSGVTIIIFPLRDMVAMICSLRRLDMKLQQLTIFRDTHREGRWGGRGGKEGR